MSDTTAPERRITASPVFTAWSASDQRLLAYEDAIVWVEDPVHFEYVREWIIYWARTRARPMRFGARVIGYSTLRKDARRDEFGFYVRRIFWLASYDRGGSDPYGPYARRLVPDEAVDPKTIVAGKPSAMLSSFSAALHGHPVTEG
jgi:hypothetical protein